MDVQIACSSFPLRSPSVSGRSSSVPRDLDVLFLGLERNQHNNELSMFHHKGEDEHHIM